MKNTKKIISLLLSVLMIITSVPLMAVNSFAAKSGNYEYELLKDGTAVITKYKGSESNVTIPSEINGYKVTAIGESAFLYCTSLKSVTIPDSVTVIDEYAFWQCRLLESVTIPDSVTVIDEYAFWQCRLLESIDVAAENVNYSSENGILFNKDKTELLRYPEGKTEASYTIPDSVTVIGACAFVLCNFLQNVTIPDGVISIGQEAFLACTALKSVTIPDSVISIGKDAFSQCDALESVVIGNGVTLIDADVFNSCSSLKCITIPDSVTKIDDYAFFMAGRGFTIYGVKGSAAEKYANKNSISFVNIFFPDVAYGEWYYNAIKFNVDNNYFHGYGNGYFGPANNIQRQDFVVVLSKIAGVDLSAYAGQNGGFADVPANDYYSAAVAWAKDNHILSGYANGKFGVGDPITREQACLIFYNYCNGAVSGDVSTVLAGYPDGGNVSDWARTAVAWAAENHVVGGNGRLNPAGNANRAEMAQIIMNMSNNGIL